MTLPRSASTSYCSGGESLVLELGTVIDIMFRLSDQQLMMKTNMLDLPAIKTEISSIRDAMQSCCPNLDELCNPLQTHVIPWPSLLPPPGGRFMTLDGDVRKFQYMGRSQLTAVLGKATSDGFNRNAYSKLYLYGPSGVGKSHILAALVVYLVQQGKRVVYIPDCRAALRDPFTWIRDALLFAFYGDDNSIRAISEAGNTDDLISIVRHQHNFSLFLIVDQCNAMDYDRGNEDRDNNRKQLLHDTLSSIGSRQKYISSASAGMQADRDVTQRQSGIEVIRFYAGMTEVCPHFFELPFLTFPRMRQTPGSNTTRPGSPKNTATLSRT